MSGVIGMMGGGAVPDLKKLASRVQAMRYCGDTYHVTTADGKNRDFWEWNLRFKTDSGSEGCARTCRRWDDGRPCRCDCCGARRDQRNDHARVQSALMAFRAPGMTDE
jgi:hypothetical protein